MFLKSSLWETLLGCEVYRDVLGSSKFVVAQIADQSELAWRVLSRRYAGVHTDDQYQNVRERNEQSIPNRLLRRAIRRRGIHMLLKHDFILHIRRHLLLTIIIIIIMYVRE
ncbi:hypothetical protein BDQ17DRAFT_832450 [Cyathus striatus]|nr:hypothetical protein BDQ17DRAFT_832450 [Cyathus striatus]